jgi:hypothetical protein
MKYYQYLDLDYKIACEKLKLYFLEKANTTEHFWTALDTPTILKMIPEIQYMFNPLKINVKQISLIKSVGTSINNGIHRDHTTCNVRVNLPIMNCEESFTNFYSSSAEPTKVFSRTNGVPYYQLNLSDCKLIDSMCLHMPAALRVREPHQVVANKQCLPRVSCTIEFYENIDYLLD